MTAEERNGFDVANTKGKRTKGEKQTRQVNTMNAEVV